MSDQPDHGRQREREREREGRSRAVFGPRKWRGALTSHETTKSAPLCSHSQELTAEPEHRLAIECLMPISPELIHSNSQLYRVYTRSSAIPTDGDIFITSAGKLTTLSVMTGGSMEGSGVRIDRMVFIDLVIYSLTLTTFGLSCRSLLKSSTELQGKRMFGDKVTPVFVSYRSKADSRSL